MEIRHISYSLARSIRQFLQLLAASGENEKSDNAAGGGVMNLRTDKLDDGTDPVGWYADD